MIKLKEYFKKSKFAILSLMLMLVIAGYINYEYNPQREKNLGQTVYVNSSSANVASNNESSSNSNVATSAANSESTNTVDSQNDNVNIYGESEKNYTYLLEKGNDVISVFKYDRENMYSELIENYKEIINNKSSTDEMVNEYQKKMDETLSKKNLISMVENVIISRGIESVAIIPTNDDKLNVVIQGNKDITSDKIATVEQILKDEFGINSDKITITTYNNSANK